MIFDRDKKYNSFYGELIIHATIFISISLNLFKSNFIVDFTLLTCLVVYLSKGSKINWHYSLLIFFWGVYCDLIIGYPIGYSSSIFLFFLLLNQVSHFLGIYFIDMVKFLIFTSGLFFVSVIEYLTIYFQFNTNISIPSQLLEILFILLIFHPINYFLKTSSNFYETKE